MFAVMEQEDAHIEIWWGVGAGLLKRGVKRAVKTPPCLSHYTRVPLLDGLTRVWISRDVSDLPW